MNPNKSCSKHSGVACSDTNGSFALAGAIGLAEEWVDRAWDRCNHDPESAEGDEVFFSTYKHWVGYQNGTCAMYLKKCIPPGLRRQLTKIRLGCHNLAIHEQRKEGVSREHRYCKVCNMVAEEGQGQVKEVEDIMHFMLHCGCYAAIRAKYSGLFARASIQGVKDADILQLLFADKNQLELACCVDEMLQHRKRVCEGHGAQAASQRGCDAACAPSKALNCLACC